MACENRRNEVATIPHGDIQVFRSTGRAVCIVKQDSLDLSEACFHPELTEQDCPIAKHSRGELPLREALKDLRKMSRTVELGGPVEVRHVD